MNAEPNMEKIIVTVGPESGDLTGSTHIAIQAAIDYVARLGGGVVRLDAGVYELDCAVHLASGVELCGAGDGGDGKGEGQTILRRGAERVSPLLADADQHEREVTVREPELFPIGQSITVRRADVSKGFLDTTATVIGKRGNVLYLDRELYATVLMKDGGIVTTMSPVVSAYHCRDIALRHLRIDGNLELNSLADGCRHGGIYLFQCHDALLEHCHVSRFNGDGISYQGGSDIVVRHCECSGNAGKGIHPGSGTSRTRISHSQFRNNGMDGIFFCWRARDGIVEHCDSSGNRMSGFSIGHKDTGNVISNNQFSGNRFYGLFFRNEPDPMAANHTVVKDNVIEDNGSETMGFVGIRLRGFTRDVEISGNRITFPAGSRGTIGICLEEHVSDIRLSGNTFENCRRETHSHWLLEE
ncbi:right-handed parallel beta-helix repeat-containing protein [Paenibacillus koleovorans]|uniref:right-handed parallel beta-helix repeat-containing protein n=1 Tax=Paenibacillus koleovorans TaxID=121608 RepID=UPI0013E2D9F2|nr:right-handed parallel beta-helix repeat-containing protein [Paenibacillus koleovorans]